MPGFDPQVIVPLTGLAKTSEPTGFQFAFDLKLSGTEKLAFLPVGDHTEVLLTSPWPSPSFVGAYLPERRDIDAKGFSAEWIQNFLGHESYQMTMDMYGTISIDEMQEIAARLLD